MKRNIFWIKMSITLSVFLVLFTLVRVSYIEYRNDRKYTYEIEKEKIEASNLKNELLKKDVVVKIKAGNFNKNLKFKDLDGKVDVTDFSSDKNSNSEKVLNIEKKYNNKFKIEISMNKVKLNDLIDEIYKKTYVEKADKSLKIVGDEFFYYTGREGNEIDKSELYSLISKKIKDFDDSELNIAIKIDEPKEVPVDEIEKLINVPVKEVTYRLIDNEIKIIESSMGFRYTKSEIKEFLKSTESVKDEKIRIPVNEIIPEYTSEEAEKLLFNSTLASENMKFIYTIFPYDRFNNVKKSISQLDEYVVLPGEVFSFNKVIGECTIEKGYLDGGTLYNGENSSGVGAGICQTVSLLNMAVTNTGLEIIEKTNSQENAKYIDDEVNLDISYPNIDYKFKNTTLFPIKILGKVSDKGEINISIIGTKSDL